mmetsp:Transcript_71683/g.158374  ORF Transcript_71683/g.158374 Transcript_71683/m.158374 type:complete len:273 (-) Transcript_71683:500-1318(-)
MLRHSCRRVDDHHRSASIRHRQQGLISFNHGTFHLLKGVIVHGHHHINHVTLRHALGQELLQRPQRGVDQLLVLQQLLDVALHLALEHVQLRLWDVVVHWQGGAGVTSERRLRSHEDRDEGTRALQKFGAHVLSDGSHVFGLRDQVRLETLHDEIPQPGGEMLHQPVVVIAVELHRLARVIHLHGLIRHLFHLQLLHRARHRFHARPLWRPWQGWIVLQWRVFRRCQWTVILLLRVIVWSQAPGQSDVRSHRDHPSRLTRLATRQLRLGAGR